MTPPPERHLAHRVMDADMPDYSGSHGNDFETLSRDRFLIRSLEQRDLERVVFIDSKLTGTNREAYYQAKFTEVMRETGVRVSLVAEEDGIVIGFVMARVDFGEFGKAEPAAAIDAIGVHPAYGRHGIGNALIDQLLTNLSSLHVDQVRSMVRLDNFRLLRFLQNCGFNPSQRLVLTKTL